MTQLLTINETELLAQQEAIIERGLQTFYEVGSALAAIREQRLYRADYPTFEEYCQERWGMARRTAYQYIEAAETFENVRHGAQILPENERQTRPLAGLTPDLQREVWQQAVETAPNGKVTAAHVASVVEEFKAQPYVSILVPEPEEDETPRQSQPMSLLASSKNDSWRTPLQYINAAREVMGGTIDLDPATSFEANEKIGATYIYTREDDGLSQVWEGRVWLNPPYGKTNGKSNQGLFATKLAEEYRLGRVKEAILLVNLYSGYEWFAPLRNRVRCEPDHRISFINPDTGEEGDEAKASSVFIYFGPDPERFIEVFSRFGYCYRPERRGNSYE